MLKSHGARKGFHKGNMGCELERVANRGLGYRPFPRVAMGRIALASIRSHLSTLARTFFINVYRV